MCTRVASRWGSDWGVWGPGGAAEGLGFRAAMLLLHCAAGVAMYDASQ